MTKVKPPPLLLGAVLLFWGWQSGFTGVGAILGLIIELPRWSKVRWEISEEEFSRVWVFCTLLLLASVVYAFTLNEGPSRFSEMFQDPDLRNQSRAGVSSARTAAALIRWVPMIFFLFVVAQQYSIRGGVPLETISLILRRRWKKAKKEGKPLPPSRSVDVSYVYFILCLFSASVHGEETRSYFWGAGLLTVWGLWPFRSRRFHFAVWASCICVAFALAWGGQKGLSALQQYVESLNPQWLSTFQRSRFDASQTKTQLGQIGRLQSSPKIVIRVNAKDGFVPDYLREASYNVYRGETWHTSTMGRDFERVDEQAPGNNFSLVPGKTNIGGIQISCFLSGGHGLLPLPLSTGRLTNLPAFLIEKNSFGAVHARGPGLIIFEAMFGPGSLMDSPPDEADLGVSEREMPALDAVIDQLDLRGKPRQVVLETLEKYFADFAYSLVQPSYEGDRHRRRAGPTPLSRFLLETHSGHCEYFATATVILLHRLNIPARYTVGYRVHEALGEGRYIVRQRDAHAWCLVWDEERKTWREFDTTPATALPADTGLTWRRKLGDAWSWLVYEILRIRWGQTALREYILWIVIPILFILLGQIIFTKRRKARTDAGKSNGRDPWPGLDSELYQLEKPLRKKGVVRAPNEPIASWLERGTDMIAAWQSEKQIVQELVNLHYRYRFDPNGLSAADRERLRQNATRLAQVTKTN